MKATYRLLDAGQFVDIVDSVCWQRPIRCCESGNVLEHPSSGGKDIHCIELFSFRRTVEEEGICIDVGDLILEWYPPNFGRWTVPAFEDGVLGNSDPGGVAIVDVDLSLCCR